MIDEEDEFKFDFDILDPTKLWPEEPCAGEDHWENDAEPQPG